MVWTSGGANHRPLELSLGRRGGIDPSAAANSAKCVPMDSYGRGYLPSPDPMMYSNAWTQQRILRPGPGNTFPAAWLSQ
eukprot:2879605-Amphidinium_carterae.1